MAADSRFTRFNRGAKKKVHDMLRNQCKVFSKDPSDIGNISDFQMDINLTDSLPVHESYCSIPRKLYDEVKTILTIF